MDRITVAMAAPRDRPCGIADHAAFLSAALSPSCEVTWLALPGTPDPAEWRETAARADTADVVHVHFEPQLFCLPRPWMNRFATFMRRLRAPALVSLHDAIPDLRGRQTGQESRTALDIARALGLAALRGPWRRAQYRKASHWLVHAPDLAATVAALTGPERITFHPHPSPPVDRVWSAADEHPLDLISPGFLKAHKGYFDLLQTLAQRPGLTWEVAGGPQDEYDRDFAARFSSAIDELHLTSRVRVTGYLARERMEQLALRAKAAIFPFERAAGSSSLTWAMAMGLPILASDLPAFSEFAKAGAGVSLLPSTGHSRWVEPIDALLRDREEQARLSRRNIEFASGHGYGELARHVMDIYRRLAVAGARA